jgi:hypothetical protein
MPVSRLPLVNRKSEIRMESRVPPKYIPFEASKADLLSFQLDLLPFLYPLTNCLKRELAPSPQQG